MSTDRAAVQSVLVGIADPTRLQILDVLAMHGTATATTLAAELPVTRQAVVKHLAVLERAGLVTGTKSGREVRYALRPERLETSAQWLARLAEDWDVRLRTFQQPAPDGSAAAT